MEFIELLTRSSGWRMDQHGNCSPNQGDQLKMDHVFHLNNSNSTLERQLTSKPIKWKGNSWTLEVFIENQERHIGIRCDTKKNPRVWPREADIKFTVVSRDKNISNHVIQMNHVFDVDNEVAKLAFKSVKLLNTFISKNQLVIAAEVRLSNLSESNLPRSIDFKSPRPNMSDCVLVINNTKLYVSKAFLATFSSYFHTLFYSDINGGKDEYVVKNVDLDQFVDLLHIIHPTKKRVTDTSVAYLLELAERFEIPYVTVQSERYLVGNSSLNNMEIIKLADKYNLNGALNFAAKQVGRLEKVKEIMNSTDYNDLTTNTKLCLLEGLVQNR